MIRCIQLKKRTFPLRAVVHKGPFIGQRRDLVKEVMSLVSAWKTSKELL
jgi:hypothetical protein